MAGGPGAVEGDGGLRGPGDPLRAAALEVRLTGPADEPVDLWRTFISHGLASLPPCELDEATRTMAVTVPLPDGPRTVRLWPGGAEAGDPATACAEFVDAAAQRRPDAAQRAALTAALRRMLGLDDDLSGFYARAATDTDLAWACAGAGRMFRSPSVFEDVIRVVCTTNCAWSATTRMIGALVEHLGPAAPGAPPTGPHGRAFPWPAAMAAAGDDFYRDAARAGYRGAHLRRIATEVAEGRVDLEPLLTAPRDELSDDEVERRLLALPGVGPYAAAHVMLLLGRHSRLILDSWTRPKYARLAGRMPGRLVPDRSIARRFRRYREHAGLAFWLVVTRDWAE